LTNPFDDENASYLVLVNTAGQHSLWPGFIAPPGGWTVVFGAADRAACLDYVAKNWPDTRQ
jgi:MbtH protein